MQSESIYRRSAPIRFAQREIVGDGPYGVLSHCTATAPLMLFSTELQMLVELGRWNSDGCVRGRCLGPAYHKSGRLKLIQEPPQTEFRNPADRRDDKD